MVFLFFSAEFGVRWGLPISAAGAMVTVGVAARECVCEPVDAGVTGALAPYANMSCQQIIAR